MSFEAKLKELGVELPESSPPQAAYVPTVITGSLLFTAGQLPRVNGTVQFPGKLGQEVSIEQGREAARICAINCLAVMRQALGSLDRVRRIVKVVGFVNSAAGFGQQPVVLNGASEFLQDVFGEAGQHARSSVGVAELPSGAPVEIELIAEID